MQMQENLYPVDPKCLWIMYKDQFPMELHHDANEFLTTLLSDMFDEQCPEGFQFEHDRKYESDEDVWNAYIADWPSSLVDELFTGMLKIQIKCKNSKCRTT